MFVVAMLRIAMGIGLDGAEADLAYTYDGKHRAEWENWNVSGVYKKIMEEVFLTEHIYTGGYDEVIEKIEARTAGNVDEGFLQTILEDVKSDLGGNNGVI